jgi:hypothetical protein
VAANHDTAHRIHDIANLHIWSDASHRHDRVHRQRVTEVVIAVDGRRASRVLVLPDAEVMVDEGVVHPEDGVTGTGRDVRHDGSDTVVSVGMRTTANLSVRVSLVDFEVERGWKGRTHPPSEQLSILA